MSRYIRKFFEILDHQSSEIKKPTFLFGPACTISNLLYETLIERMEPVVAEKTFSEYREEINMGVLFVFSECQDCDVLNKNDRFESKKSTAKTHTF